MKRTHQRRFGEIGSLLVIICALLLPLLLAHCSDPLAGPTRDPAANNPRLLEKGSASGTLAGGAQFFISVPPGWEGLPKQDIVVYAHGYMAVGEPWTPQYDKVDGKLAAEIVNSLGYAYASTSYRYGGLAKNFGAIHVKYRWSRIWLGG